MMTSRFRALVFVMVAAAGGGLFAGGCAHPDYIPMTQILNTPTNHDILDVCEEYRTDVERRDAPAILALIDPSYTSRAVSPKDDDVGYERFRDVTVRRMQDLKVITLNVEYRGVDVSQDGNTATVEVYQDASFQLRQDQDQHWHRYADYGKYTLVHKAGRWLFTSGL
jgi:hypothetical protein